ncbi:ankyrin repeat domain-containing protein [Streptomyces sp. NPDC020719]|uniref:ankyrin repeat domain-containing protein n=1 Tax=unclassified Streptomyces TaxID=2593676 RepID=UPI0033D8618C
MDLFEAVLAGDDDAVMRALRSGTTAEHTDAEGMTALYLAAVENRPGAVRLLLAAGADPERASGPDAADLPLCGAACGGHTEVVRSLLAAGARPDLREGFGFTAMTWAVRLGHAATAEALLAAGADPSLPAPTGEPPLVLAARRGSLPTVRALLRHGAPARREALTEARLWLTRDIADELRRQLVRTYGEEIETVVRRVTDEDGVTVVAEARRDGETWATVDQQTAHAEIVTALEA